MHNYAFSAFEKTDELESFTEMTNCKMHSFFVVSQSSYSSKIAYKCTTTTELNVKSYVCWWMNEKKV